MAELYELYIAQAGEMMADDSLREIHRKGGYPVHSRRVWKASSA
jgi:hypothetical protein